MSAWTVNENGAVIPTRTLPTREHFAWLNGEYTVAMALRIEADVARSAYHMALMGKPLHIASELREKWNTLDINAMRAMARVRALQQKAIDDLLDEIERLNRHGR